MGRVVRILLLSLALVGMPAASAWANGTAVQATDPSANSPAGVVYSIPLDSARQDAAPHGHSGSGAGAGTLGSGSGGSSGGSTGGGTTGASGSSGTSGSAGGTTGGSSSGSATSASTRSSSGGAPILVTGGQPGSLIHSSNGFGSSSQVPGLNTPASVGLSAVHTTPSSAPMLAILLSIVVLALGGYIGVAAWRGPRRRQAH